MKINWSTVVEIFIGVALAGMLLVALNGMMFHHLAEIGEGVHGTPTPGK